MCAFYNSSFLLTQMTKRPQSCYNNAHTLFTPLSILLYTHRHKILVTHFIPAKKAQLICENTGVCTHIHTHTHTLSPRIHICLTAKFTGLQTFYTTVKSNFEEAWGNRFSLFVLHINYTHIWSDKTKVLKHHSELHLALKVCSIQLFFVLLFTNFALSETIFLWYLLLA